MKITRVSQARHLKNDMKKVVDVNKVLQDRKAVCKQKKKVEFNLSGVGRVGENPM